jgi:DNA-binding transcriptional regulator YdaS (Cro superfamily)
METCDPLIDWRKSLPEPTLQRAGEMIGVSAVQMHRLEKGKRPVTAEKAVEIEGVTGIPRHKLRPDIFPAPQEVQP